MRQTVGRRMGVLAVAAAALVAYLMLAPEAPRTQTVHFVLGDAAPRVDELRVRYAPDKDHGKSPGQSTMAAPPLGDMAEDWTREVAFRFADGGAPRIVTHEPRLA